MVLRFGLRGKYAILTIRRLGLDSPFFTLRCIPPCLRLFLTAHNVLFRPQLTFSLVVVFFLSFCVHSLECSFAIDVLRTSLVLRLSDLTCKGENKLQLISLPGERAGKEFVCGRTPVEECAEFGSRGMVRVESRADVARTTFSGEKAVAAVHVVFVWCVTIFELK